MEKTQSHSHKKEETRSITYRLPAKIIEELETVSTQKNISQNVLVKQILERYTKWDRFAKEIGDRKSTRLNSSHSQQSRMPSSA